MKVVSLYSGAGGMDVGFTKAGFEVVWANDVNKYACETYKSNIGNHIQCGDIDEYLEELTDFQDQDISLVIGGPPCQGFSVAGKMNPDDPRSKHVWTFTDIVELIQPKAFIMENVKALGKLTKWQPLRDALVKRFQELGYATNYIVLNATDFDVPQARERVFFIGFKTNVKLVPDLEKMLEPYKRKADTVREVLGKLDRAGDGNNQGVCKAKITFASKPVLRKSPYAGMLFNGLGRPIKLDGYCATLPASMGGNKTPIIDEEEFYELKSGWIEKYHADLRNGGEPLTSDVPKRLRRLTVEEAALLQTFPLNYSFCGSQSATFTQIGNAVPCNLAYHIAKMVMNYLIEDTLDNVLLSLSQEMKNEI